MTFCHPTGFIAGAKSLEDAKRMADMALENLGLKTPPVEI
jgi:uncharacterized UPF0160 family protein